jgi:hypothetical protein
MKALYFEGIIFCKLQYLKSLKYLLPGLLQKAFADL